MRKVEEIERIVDEDEKEFIEYYKDMFNRQDKLDEEDLFLYYVNLFFNKFGEEFDRLIIRDYGFNYLVVEFKKKNKRYRERVYITSKNERTIIIKFGVTSIDYDEYFYADFSIFDDDVEIFTREELIEWAEK